MSADNPVAGSSAARTIARHVASLVRDHDVIGTAVEILRTAAETTGAAAGGVTMRSSDHQELQVLAATSHRAEFLELLQAQHRQGPCIDAVESGRAVTATSAAEIDRRWPDVAAAFRAADVDQVKAAPLSWRGEVIGALNLFSDSERGAIDGDVQVFADLITLAIVNRGRMTPVELLDRTRGALDERTVIEQAKGVLSFQYGVDMYAAYALLLRLAQTGGESLANAAATVVRSAGERGRATGIDLPETQA